MRRTDLEERLIDFSVMIIEISANLKKTKPAMILESQILRSGTSCSLNYGEATGAESDKDFTPSWSTESGGGGLRAP